MSYAQAKGRAPASAVVWTRASVAPIDSQAEHDRIAANYSLVKQHMPEIVPFIKGLHAVGLIDGLRAIRNVQVFQGKEP